MANSTWLEITNRVARLTGIAKIADATEFNAETDLGKDQIQCKDVVKLVHEICVSVPRVRFLLNEFTLTTVADQEEYACPAATDPTLFKEDSWYISTSGSGRSNVQFRDFYEWYKRLYPEGQPSTYTGVPEIWFLFPPDSKGAGEYIGLSPIPDAVYSVKFSAWLKPVELTAGTTEIMFPQWWEHILVEWSERFLRDILGDNSRRGDLRDELKSTMKQNSLGPPDQKIWMDVGIEIPGVGGADDWKEYDVHEY